MAFTGVGQRLGPGQGNTLPPWESITPPSSTTRTAAVPSLKDLCLSTLDRYVDLLDDIGTTPYYLIESVLRKCNVKQLTRIELHTEGLSQETDELWYIHTLNHFGFLREGSPVYDHSGEWRSKYQAMKKQEEEKFAKSSARLRQTYSQYDHEKQERRVILDPSLKPKKTLRQPGSSSWSTPVAPKKKSLFEKARMEARKITQMYNTNPYPPPRSRTVSSNNTSNANRIQSHSAISGHSTQGVRPGSGRIHAPTSLFTNHSTPVALGPSSYRQDRTPLGQAPSKITPHAGTNHSGSSSNGSSMSPTSPTRSAVHAKPAATSPNGAIMDFFKQINPAHSQQATSSHHVLNQGGSRSPTSPVQPASKTMQMLREPVAEKTAGPSNSSARTDRSGSTSSKKQDEPKAYKSGDTMKEVKIDGDFSWLEDDDDDDDDGDARMDHGHPRNQQHKRSHSGGHFQEGSPPAKKPLGQAHSSLDEANPQSF
ncbi:hypothetical protein K457DRAFT_20545 [Linnemannia elongata AG-77]|uniref:Elongin-A n=1 Tax=Linnemannia elongata AG-77 TaxID=1314771 RepID=A0A197JV15_9FUNG|nr:hypothetical protein K457DRAFT_20545 [Linnemannia elongata AG-77]